LVLTFEVVFPPAQSIPEHKLKLLEQILPPKPTVDLKKSDDVLEVVLSDYDNSRKGRSEQYMDEDEDEHQGHGPGVQCAQQ
jgi:DnaJ family protein A protein 2